MSAYRYYLRTDLLTCSTIGDEYQALRSASLQSADSFWEEVYRQGYTYIAYEKNYTVRHLYLEFEPRPENAPAWMKLAPIYNAPGDQTVAYKIIVMKPPPLHVEKSCKSSDGKVWEATR